MRSVMGTQEFQISIHAPRTGSDNRRRRAYDRRKQYFNPRSPHGERLLPPAPAARLLPISIHAPRTGSDAFCDFSPVQARISIHAPRTGSDAHAGMLHVIGWIFQSTLPARGATVRAMKKYREKEDFNPRSPHGERPDEEEGKPLLD